MRLVWASLVASTLIACGSEPDVTATLYVDPPLGNGCVGVAGFVVTVTPTGSPPQTSRMVPASPILKPDECALPDSFTISSLAIDAPVSVTINGYDGTGTAARVSGGTLLDSLRETGVRLELKAPSPPPPPLLVLHRKPLLEGATWPEVRAISISRQMGMVPLLTVDRESAADFFEPEPGAYGIPGLKAGGIEVGEDLNVKFTVPNKSVREARIKITSWNDPYYFAQ